MTPSWAESFITESTGPSATVWRCNICGYLEAVHKGRRGVGPGWGFRERNKARGRMINHILQHHPEQQPGREQSLFRRENG